MNHEIVEISEKAMEYEPYGEALHINFMEALMEIGEIKYANNHYKYITSQFYKHLSIKPSNKMKDFYLKLKSDKKENNDERIFDLKEFEKELNVDSSVKGGLIFQPHNFNLVYNLEVRRMDRKSKKNIYIGIITVESGGYSSLSKEELKIIMDELLLVLFNKLRQGDIISKWNRRQVACLIYDINEENLTKALNRLNKEVKNKIKNKNVFLKFRFKHI